MWLLFASCGAVPWSWSTGKRRGLLCSAQPAHIVRGMRSASQLASQITRTNSFILILLIGRTTQYDGGHGSAALPKNHRRFVAIGKQIQLFSLLVLCLALESLEVHLSLTGKLELIFLI